MAGERASKRRRTTVEGRYDENKLDPPTHAEHAGFRILQNIACQKLCGKRAIPQTRPSEAHAKIESLLRQTIEAGEGNSMLVIGPRSSNASQVVRDALKKISEKDSELFHVVWLNGAIHSDDKLAVREIWRQLGREMEIGEEGDNTRSYADTLAKLLAMLTHAPEVGGDGETQQRSKSVIFILKEFEQFTYHNRQTLLYNLFDIAQSSRTPIAVLGLTTHVNVVDMLEKRVKSRFSQRHVFLPRPRDFEGLNEAVKAAMDVQRDELSTDEVSQLVKTVRNGGSVTRNYSTPKGIKNGVVSNGSTWEGSTLNGVDEESEEEEESDIFVDARETLDGSNDTPRTPQSRGSKTKKKETPKTKSKSKTKSTPKSRTKTINPLPEREPEPDQEEGEKEEEEESTISDLLTTWTTHITLLLSSKPIQNLLTHEFYTSKCLPSCYTLISMHLLSAGLSSFRRDHEDRRDHGDRRDHKDRSEDAPTEAQAKNQAQATFPSITKLRTNPPSQKSKLSTLPTLSLSLLISAARLEIITGSEYVNFQMAYEEYTSLVSRSRLRSYASGAGSVVGSGAGAGSMVGASPHKSTSTTERASQANTNANARTNQNKAWSSRHAFDMWEILIREEMISPIDTSVQGISQGSGRQVVMVDKRGMCRVEVRLEDMDIKDMGMDRMLREWVREI